MSGEIIVELLAIGAGKGLYTRCLDERKICSYASVRLAEAVERTFINEKGPKSCIVKSMSLLSPD